MKNSKKKTVSSAKPTTMTLRNIQEVGTALERLRKQKGWSQTDLAKKTGVRQGTISDLEKKDKVPTLKTFFSILAALDFEVKISSRMRSDDPYSGLF